jgi:hypothetical protein
MAASRVSGVLKRRVAATMAEVSAEWQKKSAHDHPTGRPLKQGMTKVSPETATYWSKGASYTSEAPKNAADLARSIANHGATWSKTNW